MTAKEFVSSLQGYYGPYSDGQRAIIGQYLLRQPEDYLAELLAVVIKRYSWSIYGRPPDVAIFEQYSREAEQNWLNKQKPKILLEESAAADMADEEAQRRFEDFVDRLLAKKGGVQ